MIALFLVGCESPHAPAQVPAPGPPCEASVAIDDVLSPFPAVTVSATPEGYAYHGPMGIAVWRGPDFLAGLEPAIELPIGEECLDVVAPGDVDGDGGPDVGVYCHGADRAVLFRGGALLSGELDAFADFGAPDPITAVLALGDIDGDGRGDLGLEARPEVLGGGLSAWGLVLPAAQMCGSGDLGASAWTLAGWAGLDGFDAPHPAGDVDGDGLDDVAAGAAVLDSSHPERWAVHVFAGGALSSTAPGDVFASALLSVDGAGPRPRSFGAVGDLDGDGREEFAVIPEPSEDGGARQGVIAVAGWHAWPDLAMNLVVSSGVAGIGGMLIDVGDLDGDGRAELAAVLFGDDGVARTLVVSGAELTLGGGAFDASSWVLPQLAGEQPTIPCDLDGDGLPELIGSSWIRPGTSLLGGRGEAIAMRASSQLACVGDLDGDGTSEVAAGGVSFYR